MDDLACPICREPAVATRQEVVMRGTVVAHRACDDLWMRVNEYLSEHPEVTSWWAAFREVAAREGWHPQAIERLAGDRGLKEVSGATQE